MARLIDLGEALRMVQNSKDDCPETSIKGRAIWETAHNCAVSCLTNCDTVDAVEVVRCKDCKYWENGKDYEPYCNHFGNMMTDTQADDFCSYGERRTDEGKAD